MPPVLTVTPNPAIDQTVAVDRFAPGRVNRVRDTRSHAGGKGVNVAAALADSGAAVRVTGWLGDANDGPFRRLFAAKGIDDRFVRIPGETRTGLKITDAAGDTTDLNFPGLAPPPGAADALLARVAAAVVPGGWVVLAGSLPPGVDADFYGRLADAVHAGGGLVALDTSGEPLRATLARGVRVDFVKPNLAELAELVGATGDASGDGRASGLDWAGGARPTPGDVASAARRVLVARGVGLAVVSMGEGGAVFVDATRALLARPPRVAVVGTVGAGDAMVAGVVFALADGRSLEDAARLATALGADAVTRAGNDGPRGHAAHVDGVVIEPID